MQRMNLGICRTSCDNTSACSASIHTAEHIQQPLAFTRAFACMYLSLSSQVKLPAVSVPIFEDQPQLHCNVTCDFLLFAPQPGQKVCMSCPLIPGRFLPRACKRTSSCAVHEQAFLIPVSHLPMKKPFSYLGPCPPPKPPHARAHSFAHTHRCQQW